MLLCNKLPHIAKVAIVTVLEGDCIAMEEINHDQTRKSVTSQAQTLRSGLKNEAQAEFIFFFVTNFEAF